MTATVFKSQSADISEAEILKFISGLEGQECPLPLSQELTLVIETYMHAFAEHVRKFGKIPRSMLQKEPVAPLERVAMSLIRRAFAEDKALLDYLAAHPEEQRCSIHQS